MSDAAKFFQAIQAGDENTVNTLLEAEPGLAGAKNEQGLSAVLAAVYTGRNEIRDLLLARGAPLELHEAAAAGRLEKVRQFVDATRRWRRAIRRTDFRCSRWRRFSGTGKLRSICCGMGRT
jgi:ankyrin repeat protein